MRTLLAVILAGTAAVATASADAPGCSVTTLGHVPGNCRYVADGPGRYEVQTLSGFRIEISRDGGLSWTGLVGQAAIPNQPHTGVAVREGPLATQAGDLVNLSIGITWVDGPQDQHRYQIGTAEAGG